MYRSIVTLSLVIGTLLLIFCFINSVNVFTTDIGHAALIWGVCNGLLGYTL